MFSSIFESSIFNDKKEEPKSTSVDLQSAFQRLQELEAQKSDYVAKLVEIDRKIQKQLEILGKLIENKEEEIVLRGNSLSRQSSAQFESISRSTTPLGSMEFGSGSKTSLMAEASILPFEKIGIPNKRPLMSEPDPFLDDNKKARPSASLKSVRVKRELHSFKQYIIGRTERKARSILTCPYSSSEFSSTIITTSLYGRIHFWNTRTEQREHTVEKLKWSSNEKDWCEDIKWITPDTLCLAPFSSSSLTLLHRIDSSYRFQPKELPVVHSKSVNVLERLGGSKFVSGGQDKKVYLWDIQDTNRTRTLKVHDEHTSRIHSLCYVPEQNLLYSGGQDCRLFCADVETTRILYGHDRLDGSVRDILRIPGSHNSLLALYF
jgi:WD40 repeat protein